MVPITILNVLLCMHAISLNAAAEFKEADEEPFKAVCSMSCQEPGDRNDTQDLPLYTCSCSPSCVTYGDCCYDSPYRKENTLEKTESMCLSVFGRGQFRAISGCPGDNSDFCQASIGYQPPVTSRKTNTTYANIFCASCNEDGDDVVFWNVALECLPDKSDDIQSSVDDFTMIIYDSNQLWRLSEMTGTKSLCMYHAHFQNFAVIDGLELRPCEGENQISDCSPSWKNSELMKLCRSYEDPVYFGSRLFRNSHCAECNYMSPKFAKCIPSYIEAILKTGLVDPTLKRFCQHRGAKECIKYLSTEGSNKGRPYPFSSLISIKEVECTPDPGKRCCPGMMYDYRSKQCRQISQKD